jgi:hypothetical protein
VARGITETDVHTAADELVAAGERPTVERIRAHLGTGSPNTVTRHLDTWWQALGGRLEAQRKHLSMSEAPEAVATLAAQWWGVALEAAKASLQGALADERATVEVDRAALETARKAMDVEATALRVQAETAAQAERVAAAQVAELQRLVNRLEAEVEGLTRQREAATIREVEREAVHQTLEARLLALQSGADAEREGFLQHIRAIEDRASAEIDRARQEAKDAHAQLTTQARTHAATDTASRQALERASTRASEAARELGVERARTAALEAQLSKVQDLSAVVEAAIRRAESPAKARSRRRKTAGETASKR